jgi:hypothetical protein
MEKQNFLIKVLFSLVICMNISSCTRADIHTSFIKSIDRQEDFSINNIDTINQSDRTIVLIKTNNHFVNELLERDKKNTISSEKYYLAVISYDIKQATSDFVSIVKSVYVEEEGTAKGYSAWDESLIFYKYNNNIYEIKYQVGEHTIREKVLQAVNNGEIDSSCLDEYIVKPERQSYFFKNGTLYLHDPISFPVCQIDLEIDLKKDNITFLEVHF